MPAMKFTCPECGAVLKSSKPVRPGKKIRCPKCGAVFPAPAEAVQAEQPRPAARAEPAARRKTTPAPTPEPADDDDDGPGTYAVIKDDDPQDEDEDDEDSNKPDITFALDLSVKDPRGLAQSRVVRPSNWLMLFGALGCALHVAIMLYAAWPFIFPGPTGEWMTDRELHEAMGHKLSPDVPAPPVDRSHLQGNELALLEAADFRFLVSRIILGCAGLVDLLLAGLVVYGGVRMQNLESWGWSLAACIIALFGSAFGIFGIMTAIWCLTVLLDQKVKEGFQYQKEHKDDI